MFFCNGNWIHAVQFPDVVITHYDFVKAVYVDMLACNFTVMDVESDPLAEMTEDLSAGRSSAKVNTSRLC